MNPPSFADIWTYEVFLNLSSYLPLSEVEIAGGARGVSSFSRSPVVLHKRAANSGRRPVILLALEHLYY